MDSLWCHIASGELLFCCSIPLASVGYESSFMVHILSYGSLQAPFRVAARSYDVVTPCDPYIYRFFQVFHLVFH